MTTTIATVKNDLRYAALPALIEMHRLLSTRAMIARFKKARETECATAEACHAARLAGNLTPEMQDDYDYAADLATNLHTVLIIERDASICPDCDAVNDEPHLNTCLNALETRIGDRS